jgi:putative glutamine amidotransferase
MRISRGIVQLFHPGLSRARPVLGWFRILQFFPDTSTDCCQTGRVVIRPPLILIAPNVTPRGEEFGEPSLCLAETYTQAVLGAGGIPIVLPATCQRPAISECVARSDGVLLTGGEDIEPRLYGGRLPAAVRRKVVVTADGGRRDFRELLLIDEVFRQGRPMLAICRGHQLLNVALGGTLLADVGSQRPESIDHCRLDRRNEVVHEVRLTADSILAKVVGRPELGVNSTHHQAVNRLAPPLRVVAVSGDGVIEGLELKPEAVRGFPFLLSVQFHPERLAGRHREHQSIFYAFTQACVLSRTKRL